MIATILAFLGNLWSKVTPYIAIVGGILAAFITIKNLGKEEQQVEEDKTNAKIIIQANNIKDAVSAEPDAAVDGQLHEFFRD